MKKFLEGLAFVEKIVMSAVLLFVTLITVANVTVRKFTNFQFAWTEELVINLFVLLIMLGCALSVREGSMISLSLFYDRLSNKGKKIVTVIVTIVSVAFWIILLKTGWDKVLNQMASGKQTYSLGWREWVFTIYLPIGAFLLIVHNLEYLYDTLKKK